MFDLPRITAAQLIELRAGLWAIDDAGDDVFEMFITSAIEVIHYRLAASG